MTKRKAVVTGGAGFIGSHLCKILTENNYDVTVYDDLSNGSGRINLPKNIKFIKGSILNPANFKSACKNCEVVFHMAVKPLIMSFDKPEEVVKVNDYGTYLVAKACTELECKMIHVSSSEAYGTALYLPMKEDHPLLPHTIYAGSKAASELYVRGFQKTEGLEMVIVRPFNSYGEYMRDDTYAAALPNFFNRISRGLPPIIHGTGKQTRDFTYVGDTCKGIMLADKKKDAISKTFNVGQGKEVSIKKIAEIMIKKYQDITGKKIKNELKFQDPRKGDVMRHLADISHAKRVLGYKPTITLEEGIERYLRWKLKM
jgi:UDP-glucose 4-epimerase